MIIKPVHADRATPAPTGGKFFAHGELTLREVNEAFVATKTLKPVVDGGIPYTLAHSEQGHHHVLFGDDVAVLDEEGCDPVVHPKYIRVGDKPALLDHIKEGPHTHGAYTLAPGKTYEVRHARMYTPEGLRRNAD